MTDPSPGQRRYTEQEIGRILKRATEIQVAEPSSAGAAGMTLRELEDIAAEAGIDPLDLRRAALELEGGGGERRFWSRLVGQPLELSLEAAVPGELGAVGFERIVPVIQQVARDHGQASLVGRTLTWQSEPGDATRSTMVVVTVRAGETRIRVEERLVGLAKQLFGGLVGGAGTGVGVGVGVGVGIGALGSALFATVFPLGAVGIAYIAAREAYRLRVGERRRLLGTLLEGIRTEVEASLMDPALEAKQRRAFPRG
ncbi:MAG TPA: hypothetical protein VM198_06210 [Longimicrobiales bacterium]|nr:hypothetical protein [Longimicrobiales bacterium]